MYAFVYQQKTKKTKKCIRDLFKMIHYHFFRVDQKKFMRWFWLDLKQLKVQNKIKRDCCVANDVIKIVYQWLNKTQYFLNFELVEENASSECTFLLLRQYTVLCI